jgi:SAM-dependent methyltransferase
MDFGRGFHAQSGRAIDAAAYDGYIGRWSRLFVPSLLKAAEIGPGDRVLDVAVGPGEASLGALPIVEPTGSVVALDISDTMLQAARSRIHAASFRPVVGDGQSLPFPSATFDAVICQLGLQFFPDPAQGLAEFHRVLHPTCRAAVCIIGPAENAPMWGILADAVSRYLPSQRDVLHLSFSLQNADHLEALLRTAGFRDIAVHRETREGQLDSFETYWSDVEAGIGMLPQAYLSLSDSDRRSVRAQVHSRLRQYLHGITLRMSVEMLIASGRA